MKKSTQAGSTLAGIILLLLVVLAFIFLREPAVHVLETDTISWAAAAEKCKAKYISQKPVGHVKVSNCRKRLWDDESFYYYWSKPQSIFIKDSTGKYIRHRGTCQVDRKNGDIVYMTLNERVLVDTRKR